MEGMGVLAGPMAIAVTIFLIVLVIAWILLPFAMFGMKALLRELIAETRRTNDLLKGATAARSPGADLPQAGPGQPHIR